MKNRTNDWLVGGVVLGGMALIVTATMFLQQTNIFGKERETISVRFRDVGNMSIGNAVVIRGVQSGRVERIELSSEGWVVGTFSLEPETELPPDPVVLIQAATLFGEWQALIARRSAAPQIDIVLAQLADSLDAPEGTIAGAVLPDIAQLTSVAGGIAGNVASVSERVRTAFNDSAARELRLTIRNFSDMSTNLSKTVQTQSQNLDMVAAQVRAGVGDLTAGALALQRSVSRLDSATADGEVQRIVGEAELAASSLREASQRLNEISRSLQRTELSFQAVMSKADTLLGRVQSGQGSIGLLFNDPALYQNSDSLLIDVRSLIADIKKNPKRYFSVSIF